MKQRLCNVSEMGMKEFRPLGAIAGRRVMCVWLVLVVVCAALLSGCNAAKRQGVPVRVDEAQEDIAIHAEVPSSPAMQALQASFTSPQDTATVVSLAAAVDFAAPLSLEDCVQYAMLNNLEALVAAQEKRVQEELETGRVFSMLPSLLINAERSQQDPYTPSSSRSFATGTQSLEPSVSQDLFKQTESLTLSWDLLNLATSVLQWRQAAHRTEIVETRLERIKQDIVLEITRAYMRGSVAKDMVDKARMLMERAKERQGYLDKMLAEDLISKNEWLQNRIDTNELLLQMQSYEEEYRLAIVKLCELLGQRDTFDIAGIDFSSLPQNVEYDMTALENRALLQRPELFEKDLDEMIMSKDKWIALVQMFPTLEPFLTLHHDANSFLLRHKWHTYGIQLSWDLLTIPKFFSDFQAAAKRQDLEQLRRLQVTMAIITQLRLALIEFEDLQAKLPVNNVVQAERGELSDLVQRQIMDGRLEESLLIEVDLKYLLARQRFLMNYSDTIIAQALIANSVGQTWGQPMANGGAMLSVAPAQQPDALYPAPQETDLAEAPAEQPAPQASPEISFALASHTEEATEREELFPAPAAQ